MLLTNTQIDPETKRRQALARVYALLIQLAEKSKVQASQQAKPKQEEKRGK